MSKSKWLKELQKTFPDRDVLFADDLAQLVGTNHHVVKCIRSGMSLPLPTIKAGRAWGIKLSDVAEWMASRPSQLASQKSRDIANRRLQSPARQRPSLGRSLLGLKTQLEALQAQQEFLELLINEVMLLEHLAERDLAVQHAAEAQHTGSTPKRKIKPSA